MTHSNDMRFYFVCKFMHLKYLR